MHKFNFMHISEGEMKKQSADNACKRFEKQRKAMTAVKRKKNFPLEMCKYK